MTSQYKILFCDIGGVLLSNGWGRASRLAASDCFSFDFEESEYYHQAVFNLYEIGKLTLDEYLDTVYFFRPREFSKEAFIEFIFTQTTRLPDMLPWLIDFKKQHPHLKVISINNEAKELNRYRIAKFGLHDLFDAFISSGEVGMRKPDPGIFHLALGIAQAKPQECLYFDDHAFLVQIAQKTGIHAHVHESFEKTRSILESAFSSLHQ